MRKYYSADVAILNSGRIRADRIYEAREMTLGDWLTMNPGRMDCELAEVTGSLLLRLLEEGVSKYPALDGRYP